jgi:hypothetical protein
MCHIAKVNITRQKPEFCLSWAIIYIESLFFAYYHLCGSKVLHLLYMMYTHCYSGYLYLLDSIFFAHTHKPVLWFVGPK